MLDLIIFPEIPESYLKTSFEMHLNELKGYSSKVLLRVINKKLVLINKKYYN